MDAHTIERFNARRPVLDPDECWPWQGTTRRKGYGQLSAGRGTIYLAHRLAWEIAVGPIPDGLQVCHRCDNPPCCNPAHLFLGTAAENQHDKRSKGRAAKGEANGGGGKLTEADVRAIRAADDQPAAELARRYGVSTTMIRYVWNRSKWSHVA